MTDDAARNGGGLGLFGRFLTLWVGLCIIAGVGVGRMWPAVPETLSRFTYSRVSIPVAVLIWCMIYPMMVQVDFGSVMKLGGQAKGLIVTLTVNWLVKPFTMFFFAWFFLKVLFAAWIPEPTATEYVAGAILLGAAPCTAMVFVWSYLTKGDPTYTLVQVAVNDIVLLFAFAPIVLFLLGVGSVTVPFDTVFLSLLLYIVAPLAFGVASRAYLVRTRGLPWFENVFIKSLTPLTTMGLLVTLILLFSFQSDVILDNPIHIALIAAPLIVQTLFIFVVAYGWSKAWGLRHEIAAPAALIGASNFFELAVATAISLFGLDSGAAVATVVGVLVEVPVMLALVRIANRTRGAFSPETAAGHSVRGSA